jgi:ankyrin repeat protein
MDHNAWDSDRFVMLMLKSLTVEQLNVEDWSGGLYGGNTLLHHLCQENRVDCVKMLVQKGADINLKDEFGWTPLHRTAVRGSTESARVLLEHGAVVNNTNEDGNTALDLATQWGHSETAAVIREAGGRRSTQIYEDRSTRRRRRRLKCCIT